MSFTYIFSLHLTHIYSHWPPILLPLSPYPPIQLPSSHPSSLSFLVEWAYTIAVVRSFTYIFSLHLTHIYSHWPPILLPLSPYPPIQLPSSHPSSLSFLVEWAYTIAVVMSFTYIFSLHLTHIYSHWPPILLPLPPHPTHPSYFPSSHLSSLSFLVEWAYTVVVVMSFTYIFSLHLTHIYSHWPPILLPLSPYPPIQLPSSHPSSLSFLVEWAYTIAVGHSPTSSLFTWHTSTPTDPPSYSPYPPILLTHPTSPVPTHPRYPS